MKQENDASTIVIALEKPLGRMFIFYWLTLQMDNTSIYQVTLSNISLFKTFYMGSDFDFLFFENFLIW